MALMADVEEVSPRRDLADDLARRDLKTMMMTSLFLVTDLVPLSVCR
jgi:hypothetical protein